MYNEYLLPHERYYYLERQARYYELTVCMFMAALGAELEYLAFPDEENEGRLAVQLDNLNYYGSYYALYT